MKMIINKNIRLLLASKSPRRLQLLGQLGYEIHPVHQDIEENYPDDLPLEEVPTYLARLKAGAVTEHLREANEVVLASDTIVLMHNEIYHKPKDFADGVRILRALQGRAHRVVTGVCLKNIEKEICLSDTALVHFAPMSDAEIEYYLHTYKPYDKAGAYAIQEWIGLAKITKMEGSYATIMGLPTHLVYEALKEF